MAGVGGEECVPEDEVRAGQAAEGSGGVGRGGEGVAEGDEESGEDVVLLESLTDDAGVDLLEAAEGPATAEEGSNGGVGAGGGGDGGVGAPNKQGHRVGKVCREDEGKASVGRRSSSGRKFGT